MLVDRIAWNVRFVRGVAAPPKLTRLLNFEMQVDRAPSQPGTSEPNIGVSADIGADRVRVISSPNAAEEERTNRRSVASPVPISIQPSAK